MAVVDGMNNVGLINLSDLKWDEAMELLGLLLCDGWEVLGVEVHPDGVWALVQERIVEWLDEKLY